MTASTMRERAAHLREMLAVPGAFPPAPKGSGLKTVPGNAGPPVIGQTLQMLRENQQWAQRRYDRYGPVSWNCALGRRFVLMLGPDAAEALLVNRDKAFATGPAMEELIGPFFHRGILLLDFDEHLYHKRIMVEAFTRDRLRSYLGAMNPVIERGVAAWQPGERFLVLPAMKQLTLDVAAKIFFGIELGPEADRVNQAFADMTRASFSFPRVGVPGTQWARGLAGRRVMEEYLAKRLPAKRASSDEDLFGGLCHAKTDDGDTFSDADVINHMIFLLLAAHDTTTITMNSMLYQLAKNPQWQERVRSESEALGKPFVDHDDLDKLVSLDLVMKEALRMIAPVSIHGRRAVKDTEVLGYYIPQGTRVVLPVQFSHQMPEYWPDPERFDPERFAEDRREDKVHRYAWAPFGGGVHKCIGIHFAGMQIKAVLHQLLLRYRISVDPGYQTDWDYGTLPVPKDGLPVTLEHVR